MELRVLQYFLTVAREQSISAAAQALHLSQPTLSRQLKEMEEELGKTLFLRGNRKITLTKEGMILRKRAQEVMELLEKAQEEIACSTEIIAGNIHIGAGETEGIRPLIQAAHSLQKQYPLVHFHVVSGDKTTVLEELDHGLIALALIFFGARRRWVRRGLIACLFLFAVVWVVRMLLLFPHTPPMTADPGGILPRLTGALF